MSLPMIVNLCSLGLENYEICNQLDPIFSKLDYINNIYNGKANLVLWKSLSEINSILFNKTDKKKFDIFDVRYFTSDTAFNHHLGFHPGIINGLVDNDDFIKILKWIKSLVELCDHNQINELTLIFCCNNGTHRSVGMVHIFEHCMKQYDYIQTNIFYFSKNIWIFNSCNNCSECSCINQKFANQKNKFFESILDMWNEN
jgi:hypothetical protein